ncbi:MAG: hypothetical protein JWM78_2454 [Verrucomicrobiaceae bacterium]|nr:hypothetical protein [Verrucomicrobiaceae bacterium]
MKNIAIVVATLAFVAAPAFAAKPCDELKTEIAAKLDAKGVVGYTLDIVDTAQIADQNVIGSCDGGTKKITYSRGGMKVAKEPAPAPQ